MAGAVRAGGGKNFQAWPVAGILASTREKLSQRVTGGVKLRQRSADGMFAHQCGGSLAERASADFLTEFGDATFRIEPDVDDNAAAADR